MKYVANKNDNSNNENNNNRQHTLAIGNDNGKYSFYYILISFYPHPFPFALFGFILLLSTLENDTRRGNVSSNYYLLKRHVDNLIPRMIAADMEDWNLEDGKSSSLLSYRFVLISFHLFLLQWTSLLQLLMANIIEKLQILLSRYTRYTTFLIDSILSILYSSVFNLFLFVYINTRSV